MSNYDRAVTQVLTVMSGVWSTPARRVVQAARQNWRGLIESGELSLPFSLLNLERMEKVADGPSFNRFRLEASCVYVCSQSMGGDQSADVMSRLVALWDALYTLENPTFNLEDDGASFDVSGESEVMRAILDGSSPMAAGEFRFALTLDLTPGL